VTQFILAIGSPVVKQSGYPFPGEVRAALFTRAGALRYVVEATGRNYAGMLHIFSPAQICVTQGEGQSPAAPPDWPALVERAFRDGLAYGGNVENSDPDLAWSHSRIRADLLAWLIAAEGL
jgi:hypothetical protein